MIISLAGLNKAAVLAALYNASKPQGTGILHFDPRPATAEDAQEWIKQAGPRCYFDYLLGRVMKVDLSGNKLETWLYDRDNGTGAAKRALEAAGINVVIVEEVPASV